MGRLRFGALHADLVPLITVAGFRVDSPWDWFLGITVDRSPHRFHEKHINQAMSRERSGIFFFGIERF